MKKISIDSVNTVMEFLLLTFGKTTSLDVKKNLRKLGFDAKQSEVSAYLEKIHVGHEDGMYLPYEIDGVEHYLDFEIKTENRVSFRVYEWKEIPVLADEESDLDDEANIDEDELDDVVAVDARQYILDNMTTSSSVLAAILGISVGSVAAYKANISRTN